MRLLRFILLCSMLGLSIGVRADTYPARPVRLLVGFPPGGAADLLARDVAARLSEAWSQPVVVENRAGAGGTIAAAAVATAAPDGYTLLMAGSGLAINAVLKPSLPYDLFKDLVPAASLGGGAYVLICAPNAGFSSVQDLVARAREHPGTMNYGSVGIGSATHFVAEQFRIATGIQATHVPYRGGGPQATMDLMAGRIAYWFAPVAFALPFVESGQVRALAVVSPRRLGLLPDVPTLAEAGVAGVEGLNFSGLWAPAGTPATVLDMIERAARGAVGAPAARDQLAKHGIFVQDMTRREMGTFIAAEYERAARISSQAGISPRDEAKARR